MKYVIETTESGCMETITLSSGNQYSKRHVRSEHGGLITRDDDFYEQMERDGVDEEILDKVCDLFDGFFASHFMDIAELDN